MASRSTTSEYQPAPPCNRLGKKSAFTRAAGTIIDSSATKGTHKANKGGQPPLASGACVATGCRGIQK